MFEQSFIPKEKARRPWMMACALALQILAVGILILIPMIYVEALPVPDLTSMLVAPPPPPPPPPPPAPAVVRAAKVRVRTFDASRLIAPTVVPKQIAIVKDLDLPPAPAAGVIGGVPGGVAGGQPGGVIGSILSAVPGPAPAPPPKPAAPKPTAAPQPEQPVRVGGNVEAALLLSGPKPIYPVIAREARVRGDVLLDAIIGTDGRIEDLHAVSGPVLLVPAAMAAVKQWTYRPTILNGHAVKVATEIVVHFSLS